MKMVVIPIVIVLLLLRHLVMRYLVGIKVNKVCLDNTIGGALNVLFVGLCLMFVEPFRGQNTPRASAPWPPRCRYYAVNDKAGS